MKIAIAGYGTEGQQSYRYWSAQPDTEVTILDENSQLEGSLPEGAQARLGDDAFTALDSFDMIVRTAGLPPYKLNTATKIWSATNEFFAQCPAPIIGVTGSKGKGTTASLIAAILEAAGKRVWLVGNIGVAALSMLPDITADDIVVYELSSFQLWDIEQSPHIAVVLHIEQEHLNIHKTMEDYIQAKANITRHQHASDTLIFNQQNEYAAQIAQASPAHTIPYPSEETAHIRDGVFFYGTQEICSVEQLTIHGEHNQQNALAAIDAAWFYTQDPTAITAGLHGFAGLPHRLAYVATVDGVDYYDDSIATTPSAAIAALRSFGDVPKVIILGGSHKGSDFTELAEELTQHSVTALLIGEEAATIAAACDAAGFSQYEVLESATAEEFTQRAAECAQRGGVVLLSPASASFGMFKNYADRGDQFIAAVQQLPKHEA